ncbi:hypothetical protein HAX54_048354, partial [Datura stramonium]|nr:hypothetical protein [Datura stramonium]
MGGEEINPEINPEPQKVAFKAERAWKGSRKLLGIFVRWHSASRPLKASHESLHKGVKRTKTQIAKVSSDDYLLTMESVVCSRE